MLKMIEKRLSIEKIVADDLQCFNAGDILNKRFEDHAIEITDENKDDAVFLFPHHAFQMHQKPETANALIPIPIDPSHAVLRNVYFLHDLFDDCFLTLLHDLASRLPGSTESHNMIATRRFFESELLGAAIIDRLPRSLGLRRVLPSMRFIE